MNLKKAVQWTIFTLSLAACGPVGTGYDGFSGNCSSDFVSDYNRVQLTFDKATRTSLAQQFKSKYPGVKCKAEITRRGQLTASTEKIDADSDMDAIIKQP